MYNIIIVEDTDELMKLVEDIENNPSSDSVLLALTPISSLLYDLDIKEAVKLSRIVPKFKYICKDTEVIFSQINDVKEGQECPVFHVVDMIDGLALLPEIHGDVILRLIRLIADKSGKEPIDIVKNVKSTTNPDSKRKIIKEALRYDTTTALQLLIDGINERCAKVTEELDRIKSIGNNSTINQGPK